MGDTSSEAGTAPTTTEATSLRAQAGCPPKNPGRMSRSCPHFQLRHFLARDTFLQLRGSDLHGQGRHNCLTLKPGSAAFQLSQIPPRPSLRVPLAPGELRSLPQQEGQRFPQNTHSLCPMTCPTAILPDGHSVVPPHRRGPWGWGAKGASVAGAPGESITALSSV